MKNAVFSFFIAETQPNLAEPREATLVQVERNAKYDLYLPYQSYVVTTCRHLYENMQPNEFKSPHTS